jgi:CHAT domain-containing protein
MLLKKQYKNTNDIKNLKISLENFKLVEALINQSKNYVDSDKSKFFLANRTTEIHEESLETSFLLFRLTNDSTYLEHAFSTIEKNKAQILYNNLVNNEALNKEKHDSIFYKVKKEKLKLNYYLNSLENHIQKNQSITNEQEKIREKIFEAHSNLEKYKSQLRNKYPNYYRIQYDTLSFSLSDIKINKVIVDIFYGSKYIYILKIEKNNVDLKRIRSNLIDNEIVFLRNFYSKSNSFLNSKFSDYCKAAYKIYYLLLKPILPDERIESRNNIIIIPDGNLAFIPFEALLFDIPQNLQHINYKNLDYLIKKYQISYSFSVNYIMESHMMTKQINIKKIVGFGYSKNENSTLLNSNFPENLPSLAGSYKEIESISQILPGDYYTGIDATESQFKSKFHNTDLIHLAIHGSAEDSTSLNSKLHFLCNENSVDDGILYTYELYNLKTDAALTVLSACNTGLGKVQPGEGVLSLGWGFAYAGSKSVIMSLWNTNDNSTSHIIFDFYQKLIIEKYIDQALREAKLAYISDADEYTSHPSNWAAIISYSSFNKVIFKKKGNKFMIIAITGFLIGALSLFIIKRNK